MAIGRHRRAHLVAPLKAAVAALDRGRGAREERAQQLAAIAQGDPVAIAIAAFSAPRQLGKITAAEQRLARLADAAEASGAVATAAQVVGQQLKSVEIGSRIAQVGAYGQSHAAGQPGEAAHYKIEFVFQGANKTESMTIMGLPASPSAPAGAPDRLVIEGERGADEGTPED